MGWMLDFTLPLAHFIDSRANSVPSCIIGVMFEIPLFPLNTVLFPGTPLRLHIFEERYKQMVSYCRQTGSPFGVVLISRGVEAMGPPAEPHMIGCTAKIAQVQEISQGRMNILVIGEERFRILSLKDVHPYFVGVVESYPMYVEDRASIAHLGQRLRPWLERYLYLLGQGEDVDIAIGQLPRDYLDMGYLSAMMLQIPPHQKQILLELEDAVEMMDRLRAIYRREVALAKCMLSKEPPPQDISFSQN